MPGLRAQTKWRDMDFFKVGNKIILDGGKILRMEVGIKKGKKICL